MAGDQKVTRVISRRGSLVVGVVAPAIGRGALADSPASEEVLGVPSTVLEIDLRRLASRADLDYHQPATRSEEGMPIGSGTMGSLVWTTPGALHFQINRNDAHEVNSGTYSLPPGHTDCASGCGSVGINFVDFDDDVFSGTPFHQHLAVYDALMTVRGDGVAARILASNDDDVFAIEIEDHRSRPHP